MGQLTGPAANPYYIQPVEIVSVRRVNDLNAVHGGQEYLREQQHAPERDVGEPGQPILTAQIVQRLCRVVPGVDVASSGLPARLVFR